MKIEGAVAEQEEVLTQIVAELFEFQGAKTSKHFEHHVCTLID